MRNLFVLLMSFLVAHVSSAQTCNSSMIKEKPTGLYAISVDGTEVTDNQTGLVWKRCVEGMYWDAANATCSGTATTFAWDDALIQTASQSGWRLPNIKELRSLVEPACYGNAINEVVFPMAQSGTWSSSPNTEFSSRAWHCNFSTNDVHWASKTNAYVIRLVK